MKKLGQALIYVFLSSSLTGRGWGGLRVGKGGRRVPGGIGLRGAGVPEGKEGGSSLKVTASAKMKMRYVRQIFDISKQQMFCFAMIC